MEPEAAAAYLHDIAEACRLIHGYATVSDEVVWGVVEGYLPRLMAEAEGLLGEMDGGTAA